MRFVCHSRFCFRLGYQWLAMGLALQASYRGVAMMADEVVILDCVPSGRSSRNYVAHREPLRPSHLLRLPPGSVAPRGWLHQMLELQANGFHGHLRELSDFLKEEDNAWLSKEGKGQRGWEEVPYWLRGYLNCAYALDDASMIEEAHRWIQAAMASQQPDGWFGPGEGRTGVATDLVGRSDLWPNMVMLFCLQDYFGKTGDPRVLDLMSKYFRYLTTVPEKDFLVGYWPSMRGGDQLYAILWLYNRSGDEWLLDLARKTHRKTARWDEGLVNRHNVNIAQAFREPAVFSILSGDLNDLQATEFVWQEVRRQFGRVPGGMFGADENARDGYNGPRQAIETCGIVEEMFSNELLISLTGDPLWAERCENVAFNSLPAAFTTDLRGLRYLVAPNQPQSDHASKAPGIENQGDMFGMNPYGHRCCQHNSGHGWPYLNHHLWYASADDGLAAFLYAPCRVTAKVADGVEVSIEERTHYPFSDSIEFELQASQPVAFPLYLRIPQWCDAARVEIQGKEASPELAAGKVVRLFREWRTGDRVVLSLPSKLRATVWTDNRNTVSVARGPLTYSLQIDENYVRYGGTDAWPALDVLPASPWNYGLEIDLANPGASIAVETAPWPADDRPFTHATPIRLKAKARRLPGWGLDANGLVEELPDGPFRSDESLETVTLIPMGAARLRISAFPRIVNGPEGKEWPADASLRDESTRKKDESREAD